MENINTERIEKKSRKISENPRVLFNKELKEDNGVLYLMEKGECVCGAVAIGGTFVLYFILNFWLLCNLFWE